MESMRDWPIL